jgi:SAM-dependent methyltransferase
MKVSEEQNEKWNEFYKQNTLSYPDENLVRMFKGNYVGVPQNGRILDIGFGNGTFLEFAHSINYECWGKEVSQTTIDQLNHRNYLSNKKMSLSKLGSPLLDFKSDFFDVVVSWNAIYYWASEALVKQQIDEIHRVLRPGGLFLLSVIGPKNSIVDRFEEVVDERNVFKIIKPSNFDNRLGTQVYYAEEQSWLSLLSSFASASKGRVTLDLFRKDKVSDWLIFGAKK